LFLAKYSATPSSSRVCTKKKKYREKKEKGGLEYSASRRVPPELGLRKKREGGSRKGRE
jgi:hypothetical protein